MKGYHIYFILLKFLLVVQTILIIFKLEKANKFTYLVSDTIFKLSIGVFIIYFFLTTTIPGTEFHDMIVLYYAGVLLIFDAVYTGIPEILTHLGINPPWWMAVLN
jgi:hypothetical protein